MDEEAIFERLEKKLEKHCLQGIEIKTTPTGAKGVARGGSKFCGRPDLPKGVAWPIWSGTKKGASFPYSFAAQIALADVAKLDKEKLLPRDGLLSFFVLSFTLETRIKEAPINQGCVLYTAKGETLEQKTPPSELPRELDLKEAKLSFKKVTTWPQGEGVLIGDSPNQTLAWKANKTSVPPPSKVKLTQTEWEVWSNEAPQPPRDLMLGHPYGCEYPIGRDPKHRLLLSGNFPYEIAGRNGYLFFGAPLDAIKKRRWDEVHLKPW